MTRDALLATEEMPCFGMEAAGTTGNFLWLVICGTWDHLDVLLERSGWADGTMCSVTLIEGRGLYANKETFIYLLHDRGYPYQLSRPPVSIPVSAA
jgi:hypothetical protein